MMKRYKMSKLNFNQKEEFFIMKKLGMIVSLIAIMTLSTGCVSSDNETPEVQTNETISNEEKVTNEAISIEVEPTNEEVSNEEKTRCGSEEVQTRCIEGFLPE